MNHAGFIVKAGCPAGVKYPVAGGVMVLSGAHLAAQAGAGQVSKRQFHREIIFLPCR